MKTEEAIDWLADQEQFWGCISMWESISNGGRICTYPKDELTWSYIWYRDEMSYLLLNGADCDPQFAKGVQWLYDNTDRIIRELHETNFGTSDFLSLPERVQFCAAFCAQAISRISMSSSDGIPGSGRGVEHC